MVTAVDFDDEPGLEGTEVREIGSNWIFAAELNPELLVAQSTLQFPGSIGGLAAQAASPIATKSLCCHYAVYDDHGRRIHNRAGFASR